MFVEEFVEEPDHSRRGSCVDPNQVGEGELGHWSVDRYVEDVQYFRKNEAYSLKRRVPHKVGEGGRAGGKRVLEGGEIHGFERAWF